MRRSFLLLAAVLSGFAIGVVVTGSLEPVLEPILALFDESSKFYLEPVDYDPFDPCLWDATEPHDLCI